ncbi:MAG: hypothetical protein GEU75_02365 [Dehalococcoidia bacterium]|nr:hypothetical protein [Dehalococcoidia bacterium]
MPRSALPRALGALSLAIIMLASSTVSRGGFDTAYALNNCDVYLNFDDEEEELLSLINSYRAQTGAPALTISANLHRSASWLANDMSRRNYFSHKDSLKRSSRTRMQDCGLPSNALTAEIIGASTSWSSATQVFNSWGSSSSARGAMLSKSYRQIGIARAYFGPSRYDYYWVADFSTIDDGTRVGGTTPPVQPPAPKPSPTPTPPPSPAPKPSPSPTPTPSPSPAPPSTSGVVIQPGANIQSAVNANPTGATFVLKPGVHRLQQVTPKDGQSFVGESGAVLSGAKLVSFTRSGSYWVATGQTQQGQTHGACVSGYTGCMYPEGLFIDDQPLWQVTSLSGLSAGEWYFDYAKDRIYMADNPTGHKVEASVTRHAFVGKAKNVTIRGLVIEKYANPAQHGAIQAKDGTNGALSSGWVVQDNDIRFNHGAGLRTGSQMKAINNNIHHNGQIGIAGEGADVLIEGNEIAYNNTAGFNSGWEAGGTKFVLTTRLVVRGNSVHHNKGPGLWTDIDNIHTTYDDNTVFSNEGIGIFHEISYDAVIKNNVSRLNGSDQSAWLWGAQILVAGSRNVEIYNNKVEVSASYGNGIGLVQQNRGSGAHGPHLTTGNYVHHNQIVYLGTRGMSGAAADYQADAMFNGGNRFDHNTYKVADPSRIYWEWKGMRNWDGFRNQGQEIAGAALH